MRRRIAASVGLLGLIGAGWLGVRDHVVGGEPPETPVTVPAAAPTAQPIAEPFFERIDATSAKRSKRATAVRTAGSSFEQLAQRLQPVLKKRFPKCNIELVGHSGGIVIKGAAATAQDAAAVVSAVQTVVELNLPAAESPAGGQARDQQVVNQLEIPGEPQVLLHVKVIEADRNLVIDTFRQLSKDEQPASKTERPKRSVPEVDSFSQIGVFSKAIVEKATANLSKEESSKTVCEPSMAVLSGCAASFISGGKFAEPTTVGVGGAQGMTTSFRNFGTSIVVTPTVIGNEQLRLALMCEFSQPYEANQVAGIPGLTISMINTKVLAKRDQTVVVILPALPAYVVNDKPIDAAPKANKPASPEKCLFITVTPELVKPMTPDEVQPQPLAAFPSPAVFVPATTIQSFEPYVTVPGTFGRGPVSAPKMMPAEPPSFARDLLFRTPLPPKVFTQSLPPAAGDIQQMGGWQPMNAVPMPWPITGPWPSNSPAKLSRLDHLQSALTHLEAAGLQDQVAEIQTEITQERKSEGRRELKRREQELESLQRQIEELRRSLMPEVTPQAE